MKRLALRKDGRLIIERAVFELKRSPCGHPVAMCDLHEVTARQEGAFLTAQR
jgi:hypothetical protein